MATVTVTETIKNNGTPVRGIEVFIDLVAAADDPAAPGYVTGSDYTWADTIRKVTGADGIWSASLEPNANISPANTRYRIRYRFPGSKQRPDPVYIEVLTSPSTQRVEDILSTAPTDLAAALSTDPQSLHAFDDADTTLNLVLDRLDDYLSAGGPGMWSHELRTFKVAFSNRASARCNILLVADSIGQGWTATTASNRWFDRMMAKIMSSLGQTFSPGYCAVGAISSAVAYTGRLWTTSGTVTQNTDLGLGYSNVTITSGSYAELAQTCDRLWVHYPTFATLLGDLRVTIDGGAPTNITTFTGTTLGGRVWDSGSLGAAASHTVRLAPAAAVNTRAEGVTFFNGNYSSGVCGFNGAHFGYRYSHFAATGASSWWTDGLDQIAPHLVIWALGVNEQAGSYAASTIETNMATAIAKVNAVMAAAGLHAPSHLVIAPFGTGATSTATDDYRLAVWKGALTNGAACVDWSQLAGYVGTSTVDDAPAGYAIMSAADPADSKKHPNDKGHLFLGEQMAHYLLDAVGYAS